MAMDFGWLPPGQDAQRLPLGMRVNNPGNIKFFKGLNYPGMQGPSAHTDQGDPQMTFDTPQSGMNAASSLAWKKYRSGQRSPLAIIAGQRGWTPGNVSAANNVARTMGIDPNADMNLSDPKQMATFLKALTLQEHGGSSKLYADDLYNNAAISAISGNPGPVSPASSYMAANARNEVSKGAPMASPIGGAPIAGGPVPLVPPSQRYSKLADALMAQAAGAKVSGWGDALRAFGSGALGYSLGNKADEEQKAYRSKLSEALAGASPETLPATLIGSGDEDLIKAGVSAKMQQAQANAPLRGKDRFMPLPNGQIFDLQSMEPLANIGPKEEMTSDMREYTFAMKQRRDAGQPAIPFDEYQLGLKQAGASRVNVDTKQESEYEKARGKALGDEFGSTQKAGIDASNRIGQLKQLDALLSNPAVYTGTGAEAVNAVKRAAKTVLNMDVEGVGAADTARRISSEMALSLKGDLPGPMSDSDRQFLMSLPPNVGDSAEGRKLLIDLSIAKEQRKIQTAQLAREYRAQHNGRLDDGWYQALADFNQANPLVTPEMMQIAQSAARQAPQPSPTAGIPVKGPNGKNYLKNPDGSWTELD